MELKEAQKITSSSIEEIKKVRNDFVALMELIKSQINTMIGYPVLRIIVCTDFF